MPSGPKVSGPSHKATTGMFRSMIATGHQIQNPGVHPINSRVEKARYSDPSFGIASRLAGGPPNTDRRRYLIK